jgi:predicted nucleic acid-binding protein
VRFLDANIFVRLVTGDDQAKARACMALFQRLHNGDEEVTTSESVIAEVAFVLGSTKHYGLTRAEIISAMQPSLGVDGLRLPSKPTYGRALDIFAANRELDFEDALTIAHMERSGVSELYSYDRGFDGISGVTRIEP